MLLGRLLERLGEPSFAVETMVALEDLPLMVEVEAAGRRFGEDIGTYAAGAARRFADQASDEDWLSLMGVLGRADDAGAACLKHMLAWSLQHDADQPGGGCAADSCSCTRRG